ncbi:MAG: GAF domain-containing protein, partial [Deltaproteobacteria bacterium]|nr:GAF domain-containing protein [Deltaproteobacteria bacterium]
MSPPESPSVLHSVAGMLSRQVTKDRLLRAMVDRVVEELGAERGTLYLLDALSGELVSRVAHLPEIREIRLPPGTGVAGYVARTGHPVRVEDAASDARHFTGIDQLTGYTTRSMLAVPVRDAQGRLSGVLQLLNSRSGAFSPRDEERAGRLAAQVAEALERTSLRPGGDHDHGVLVDGPFNHIVGDSPPMTSLYER